MINIIFCLNLINLFNCFKFKSFSTQVYKKTIHYTRYLNFVLMGFVCSKNFLFFLQKKIKAFLNSQLHFDTKEINLFDSKENNIIFLGFNIKLIDSRKYSTNKTASNNKYLSKILARLVKNQNRIGRLSLERFKSEFFINIKNSLNTKELSNFSSRKKVFSYIFQLEAIRSTRISKLVLTDDEKSLFSGETFSFIKNLKVCNYYQYGFDLYNLQMRILLQDTLKGFPTFMNNSVLPIDLVTSKYLSEFKKKIVLLHNDYDFKSPSFNNKLLNKDLDKSSFTLYKDYFYTKETLNLKNKFLINFNNLNHAKSINLFAPFNFLLLRMRFLGFVHPYKNRPIGNPKFLFLEDSLIIKSFGYIAYSILHWYRFSDNLQKVKFFVELLRESCFLTLCRKHNKSKSWVYNVYTPDLIISQGLFDTKSFFPTRKIMLDYKKKRFFSDNFRFDEKFFLES